MAIVNGEGKVASEINIIVDNKVRSTKFVYKIQNNKPRLLWELIQSYIFTSDGYGIVTSDGYALKCNDQ